MCKYICTYVHEIGGKKMIFQSENYDISCPEIRPTYMYVYVMLLFILCSSSHSAIVKPHFSSYFVNFEQVSLSLSYVLDRLLFLSSSLLSSTSVSLSPGANSTTSEFTTATPAL
jgi:hypothetical protein